MAARQALAPGKSSVRLLADLLREKEEMFVRSLQAKAWVEAVRVLPEPAARVCAVPEIIFPVERGLRDAVTVAGEERAHRAAFLECVALVQVRIPEPAPVVFAALELQAFRHQQLE